MEYERRRSLQSRNKTAITAFGFFLRGRGLLVLHLLLEVLVDAVEEQGEIDELERG